MADGMRRTLPGGTLLIARFRFGLLTSVRTGTGFKLVVGNLKTLTLNLGNLSTSPVTAFGVSVNYDAWQTVNLTAGANSIPLGVVPSTTSSYSQTVVRIAGQGWQNNNLQLESVELNAGAEPKLYTPQSLNFQFIGDSLSAGQYCGQGVINAWTFVVSENFKAEHNVQAQVRVVRAKTNITNWDSAGWMPDRYRMLGQCARYVPHTHSGAQLISLPGLSYEFFKAEDTGYYNDAYHNYTTPWFAKGIPYPKH